MHKTLRNIHWLFWGCIPILWLYALLDLENYIGANFYDTYILVSIVQVVLWQSILFFMFGLAYYLFYNSDKYKPIDSLSIVHVVLTLIGLSVLLFMPEFQYKLPVESTADIEENLRRSKMNTSIKEFSALGVFVAQILFLINLFVSIFRK